MKTISLDPLKADSTTSPLSSAFESISSADSETSNFTVNYSSQLLEYHTSILLHLYKQEQYETLAEPLKQHNITPTFRATTIDWMIEATLKSHCSVYSFFRAVYLMDRFFQHYTKVLKPAEMHAISIVALQLATKLEEVDSIDLSFAHTCISRCKISIKTLYEYEVKFLKALEFRLLVPEEYEFLGIFMGGTEFEQIMDKLELADSLEKIKEETKFVAMTNVFNYDFCKYKGSLKAAGTLYYVLKRWAEERGLWILERIEKLTKLRGESIKKIANEIENHVKDYRKLYPTLERVYKFNSGAIRI